MSRFVRAHTFPSSIGDSMLRVASCEPDEGFLQARLGGFDAGYPEMEGRDRLEDLVIVDVPGRLDIEQHVGRLGVVSRPERHYSGYAGYTLKVFCPGRCAIARHRY